MKKDSVKKLIVLIVAFVLIAVMVIVYFVAVKKKPIQGTKTIALEIVFADDVKFTYEDLKTDQETVAQFLHEYDERLDLGFVTETGAHGLFVKAMKNTYAADGFDYNYTINGNFASGISNQNIADGDVIVFEYCKQTWDENWNPVSKEYGKLGTQNNKMSTDTVVLIVFGCVGGALVLGVAAYLVVGAVKKRKNGKQA